MPRLVCSVIWPDGADALRVRFKFSSIAFSDRVPTQSQPILFLLPTFQLHENSQLRFRCEMA
jgi:hypothetical protein